MPSLQREYSGSLNLLGNFDSLNFKNVDLPPSSSFQRPLMEKSKHGSMTAWDLELIMMHPDYGALLWLTALMEQG